MWSNVSLVNNIKAGCIQSPQHCLYHLMTERRTCDYLRGMHARAHDFQVPDFSTILHKKSFLVSALYMYM